MVSFKIIVAVVLIVGFLAAGGGTFALDKLKTAKSEITKVRDSTQRALDTDNKMSNKDVKDVG